MRLRLLLPCVVMGGLIGVSVFGQSGEEPTPGEGSPSIPVREALPQPQPLGQPQSSPAESVVQEEQELRRQYRELMELKSGLMGRSELRNAINGAVEDINELRAAEKLDQARENLLELVKMHPETKAAAAARNMLRPTADGAFVAPTQILNYDESTGQFVPSTVKQPKKEQLPVPANAPFYQQSN